MSIFESITFGLGVALTPTNILFAFLGCLVGTLVGVLPGLGPVATLAMLLPITYYLEPTTALIMLAGIYYGAQYGGSTTAILVNLPGESSSVVTALDGYQMAKKGRAGAALSVAAIGSFIAGVFATFMIALFAPPLANVARLFGPEDYFSMMVLGLVAAISLSSGSLLRSLGMVFLGLALGFVGTDMNSGDTRFTFGLLSLADGIDFVPLALGLFGVSEIISNLMGPQEERKAVAAITSLYPSREELRASALPVVRGTLLGSVLGIIPGGGALLSSFTSYALEKKLSKQPERFGKGAIEGVAGPESANNAGAQTSFIPMLTLGIPSNPVLAILIGTMMIHGIQPGPNVMNERPELFWGLIGSMWIGNLMLIVINLPMIGIWVKILQVPYRYLMPSILLFCCIGVYSINNSYFDVFLAAFFGVVGYALNRLRCEPAPLILAFVLGPMMEEYLRRALILSRGSPSTFFASPISASLLTVAAILLAAVFLPAFKHRRKVIFEE
ncbi:TctA family tripartite tricarboxylate transporter protein (plasmid) [Rhizobium gallicum]|uniref:TctA family tripartite tricarboxylate transporter protein n=1 Tax=Rhizobium gallicum TaxID=56730 RepID=A0A1L5NS85_9HYPH|nr:tripartite tricarboxylate transporter permease [Rhizobium gallicum]APO70732.1 TctA family tripartite tricarboxylate transporter protein [Rhizobium gallicum]